MSNKNQKLIDILKYFIQKGDFEYFEYGSSYLLKYDYEFIEPYINRYRMGKFTENELNINNNIKQEYIIDFAKSLKL